MPDEREKKTEFRDLQKRIGQGSQKPKPASDKAAPKKGSTSTIRLDHSRLMKIETDHSISEQVALADVITARTHSNEREECLFKRPKGETKDRGRPYEFHTLIFSVQNVKDLRYLAEVIGRMKRA